MYKQCFNITKKHLVIIITLPFLATNVCYGMFRSAPMSRFSSLFNVFRQNRTANSSNQSLATINGACTLSGVQLSNTLINGNANLGGKAAKTMFSKIIVVNGNLDSQNASFETLEVNGNSELDSCTLSNKGEFLGNAKFINCKLNSLDLRGKNFTLKDCTVTGDIIISAIIGKGKLILDNTVVEGSAKFTKDEGEIILTNGSKIGNP